MLSQPLQVDLWGWAVLVMGGTTGISRAICPGMVRYVASVFVGYHTSGDRCSRKRSCWRPSSIVSIEAGATIAPDYCDVLKQIAKVLP